MPVIVKDSSTDFEPAPKGPNHAVLVDVIDLGLIDRKFGSHGADGRPVLTDTVELKWQTAAKMADGRPFLVSQWYTKSLDDRAKLRQHLETWFVKPIPPEKRKNFDLELLLGVNCTIEVVHRNKRFGTGVRAGVAGITPPPAGAIRLVSTGYIRQIDRDKPHEIPRDEEEVPF